MKLQLLDVEMVSIGVFVVVLALFLIFLIYALLTIIGGGGYFSEL
jgi:hypothetical protein